MYFRSFCVFSVLFLCLMSGSANAVQKPQATIKNRIYVPTHEEYQKLGKDEREAYQVAGIQPRAGAGGRGEKEVQVAEVQEKNAARPERKGARPDAPQRPQNVAQAEAARAGDPIGQGEPAPEPMAQRDGPAAEQVDVMALRERMRQLQGRDRIEFMKSLSPAERAALRSERK